MGDVFLLYSKDIASRAMNDAIAERVKQSEAMVYIAASYGLKSVRLGANTGVLTEENIMTMGEFESRAKSRVYKRKSYITKADERYLLSRIIEKKYLGTEQYAVFKGIANDLLVLFDFLQWNDVSPLDETALNLIQQNYSNYEHDIFGLYGIFCNLIHALITAAKTGIEDAILAEYNISCSRLARKTIEPLGIQIKAEIDREIGKGSAVFFDGFYLLTDIIKYTIESALRQNKNVYFVANLDLGSYEEAFIYEENFAKLAAQYGKDVQTIKLDAELHGNITALDYLRQVNPAVYLIPSSEEQERIQDGSIEVIAPFVSWENEFSFVAKRISDYLRSLGTSDKTVLQAALLNDIAVLTPAHWERYTYMMKSILKKVGLFVLREDFESFFAGVDGNSVAEIYYTKQEFMKSAIRHKDGTFFNAQEKLVFFEKCFTGLSLKASPRPISAYPVGQYIRQLYSFVVDGMDTHNFKLILYSNWFYHTKRSEQKWDRYISDFDLIEHCFSGKTTIEEWIAEFERLWEVKAQIHNDPLYKFHPLTVVPNESLVFLRDITVTLCGIMKCIDFTGTIEEHVASLVHDVIDAFSIIDEDRDQLDLEQVIICRLAEAAEALSGSAFINEVDTAYFAQNLLHMLEDYEQDQIVAESGQYAFNIISMENAKKYKLVFFVMAERGKNPRNYREPSPYSREILEILTDERYGINCKPAELHGQEYHVLLNNHAFQNFLNFTQEKLIVTQSKRGSDGENAPSIYCHDIATAFGLDLEELYVYPDVRQKTIPGEAKKYKIRLPKKESYTLTELAMFKLCPKMYLHLQRSEPFVHRDAFQLKLYFQSVVFVDLIRQFAEKSTLQSKMYSVYDDEALRAMLEFLPPTIEKHLPLFSFLSSNELSDATKFLQNMIVNFVCYEIAGRNASGYYFVQRSMVGSRRCNGYDLLLDYDIEIQHGQRFHKKSQKYYPNTGIYQSSMLIDFLILHSKKTSGDFLQHYKDMMHALNINEPWQDRVSLAARMVTKINDQFFNERFEQDGIARTNALVSEIGSMNFLAARLPISSYCRYCKVSDICKGYYMNAGGDRYANG